MNDTDYPALYQSASLLSAESQKAFFGALLVHLLLLVGAAVISVINSPCAEVALVQAILLALALACAVYLFVARPERYWYGGRAVAESIKTVTWRFVTKAEPFDGDDHIAQQKFIRKLSSIVSQNTEVAQRLTSHLAGTQITAAMNTLRQAGVDERREHYSKFRIENQQSWYAAKAAFNRKKVKQFFAALMIANFLAMGFAIAKIRFPDTSYWPTDVLVTIAAGLLSWMQAKRFQELSASYALAAHEISFIRQQAGQRMSDIELSGFIGDAENAFSREHTQWAARRDT